MTYTIDKTVEALKIKAPEREVRTYNASLGVELRNEGPPVMIGYAALFGSPSQDLGGFIEVIERGAFAKAIQTDDVRGLWNHDPNFVLGRNKSGTLRLFEDERGLRVEIDPPDTQWARDLVQSMSRGDIDQMSFGFSVRDDQWEKRDGKLVRTLKDVSLFDVSPVTYPAYVDTSIAVRSMTSWQETVEKNNDETKYRADLARVNLKRRFFKD